MFVAVSSHKHWI